MNTLNLINSILEVLRKKKLKLGIEKKMTWISEDITMVVLGKKKYMMLFLFPCIISGFFC
jgi:hypothetical protein